MLDCSGEMILRHIQQGKFAEFDDFYLTEKMRTALAEANAPEDRSFALKLRSILNRRPPKLVVESERIRSRSRDERRDHRNLVHQIKDKVPKWAAHFGLADDLWHVWDISHQMTKIGSLVPVEAIADGGEEEEEAAAQGVRILTTPPDHPQSRSRLLVEHDYALAKELSNSNLYAIRLYVHLDGPEDQVRQQREQIVAYIRNDLPDFPFSA
jgi:hypothetical protein